MIRKYRGKEAWLRRERPKSAQDTNDSNIYTRGTVLLVTTTVFNA